MDLKDVGVLAIVVAAMCLFFGVAAMKSDAREAWQRRVQKSSWMFFVVAVVLGVAGFFVQ